MPCLCTRQRTFKLPPDPDDHSESENVTVNTEQQARVQVKQWIDDAFQSHTNTESIAVEVTVYA